MEFIASAILGGLLYDAAKSGLSSTFDIVKIGLKDLLLSEEEVSAISSVLEKEKINNHSTKQQFEEAIAKTDNIEDLLKSISSKNKTIQNNKIDTVNGAVIGTNTAPINMTFGKKS